MSDRIVEKTSGDLIWPFGGRPHYRNGRHYAYVDPTPCYAHDVGVVEETLVLVEGRVDILCKPTYYVLSHEPEERTNGWAQYDVKYPKPEDPDDPPWNGAVTLAGKRIPPHPAVTRYLTAHEYGHHAEYEALRRRGLDPGSSEVEAEYAKARGYRKVPRYYGAGTWHAARAEVLANDFRIIVCGVEEEYWPHECPHPADLSPTRRRRVGDWWRENLGVE